MDVILIIDVSMLAALENAASYALDGGGAGFVQFVGRICEQAGMNAMPTAKMRSMLDELAAAKAQVHPVVSSVLLP